MSNISYEHKTNHEASTLMHISIQDQLDDQRQSAKALEHFHQMSSVSNNRKVDFFIE